MIIGGLARATKKATLPVGVTGVFVGIAIFISMYVSRDATTDFIVPGGTVLPSSAVPVPFDLGPAIVVRSAPTP